MMSHLPDHFRQRLNSRLVITYFIIPATLLYLIHRFGGILLAQYRLRRLPLINGTPLFGSTKKAKQNFQLNARGLLKDGFTKSSNAFRVETDDARVVILSPESVNEIRNDNRFSFTHLIAQECLCYIPAFRNFNPHEGLNDMAKDVLLKRLTPSLSLVTRDMSEEANLAFQEHWTDNTEWHEVDAKATVVEIIARLSSRVFLGPELCRNPEWLRITIDYTMTVFHGIMALKKWPSFLHRIVWRFVPEVRRVNEQIAEAVRLIRPVIDKKMAQGKILPDGSKPAHLDVIQWASEVADGRRYDPTLLQLGFSMASMHNTTDLVTQILYDLCAHPSYIDPLRAEIETVLTEEGMTKSALARLKLMDSFMKESQRIKPSESLGMRRVLLEDVTLSNGVFLPQRTQIGIPTTPTTDVGNETESFDGYRFLNMVGDPSKEKTRHFVSTSPDHLGFGHGKHACPGRFFASHEVKIILCHALTKYDFKLAVPTRQPTSLALGWALIAEPGVRLLVKQRSNRSVNKAKLY